MAQKKTVFVSGASSGFGKLTVLRLLEKGHTVVAGLRGGQSRLETVFAEELKQYSAQLHAIDLHLEKTSELGEVVRLIDSKFGGRLDVLINNAGYGLMGVLEDQTEEQIRYQMEINFFGAALLTRALLPALRLGRGRILNVSSVCGFAGLPFYGSYCASKFALEGLSESLRYDLKPFGVQVGLIEPGGFKTGFVAAKQLGPGSANPASPFHKRTAAFAKAFAMSQARLDDPEKVARLLSKLCDSRRVPMRSVIGKDAGLVRLLRSILPARVYEFVIGSTINLALKAADR